MTKINKEKIVKAAIGSARLEGYKGSLKATTTKKVTTTKSPAKPETTAKQ